MSASAPGCGQKGVAGVAVSPNGSDVINSIPAQGFGDTCSSVLEYRADGTEVQSVNGSTIATLSRGDWLDRGANSEVWIERTINAGTLAEDFGASRLPMTSVRRLATSRDEFGDGVGTTTANVTISFYAQASGGSPIGSVTLDISAEIAT